MPNNLFVAAIIYTSPDSPAVSLSVSAIVRADPETAVAQNVAAFISENPGWKVSLVQCVALPTDFLQDSLAAIAKDSNMDGATVVRLVPPETKRRGRRPKNLVAAENVDDFLTSRGRKPKDHRQHLSQLWETRGTPLDPGAVQATPSEDGLADWGNPRQPEPPEPAA